MNDLKNIIHAANVHSSTIYNIHGMEATLSIHQQMNG